MFEYILAYILQVAAGVAIGLGVFVGVQYFFDWLINKTRGV